MRALASVRFRAICRAPVASTTSAMGTVRVPELHFIDPWEENLEMVLVCILKGVIIIITIAKSCVGVMITLSGH